MVYEHDKYLRNVQQCAEQALVQTQMLRRCELHREVLISTGAGGPAHVAENLALVWMRNMGGHLHTREDLRDAIAAELGRAQPECTECARKDRAEGKQ